MIARICVYALLVVALAAYAMAGIVGTNSILSPNAVSGSDNFGKYIAVGVGAAALAIVVVFLGRIADEPASSLFHRRRKHP